MSAAATAPAPERRRAPRAPDSPVSPGVPGLAGSGSPWASGAAGGGGSGGGIAGLLMAFGALALGAASRFILPTVRIRPVAFISLLERPG
jgi:hypothetical protein